MRIPVAAALMMLHASILAAEPVGIGEDELAEHIEDGDWEYVRKYVDAGGDMLWRSDGDIPLLVYVIGGGERELAFRMMEQGALSTIRHSDEFELLILGTMRANDLELARTLLAVRKDFPFELELDLLEVLTRQALLQRQLAFIDLLLENGADINYGSGALLETAIVMDAATGLDYFSSLIERGATFGTVETSSRLLRTAARAGNIDAMLTLMDGGANVNHAGDSGFTPLMAAIESDGDGIQTIEPVTLLLEKGADPCVQTVEGRTAYDLAAEIDRLDLLARFPQLDCAE